MRLYRDSYKDRETGERRLARRWTVEFVFRGAPRRLALFTDKGASEQFQRRLERLVDLREAGDTCDAQLVRWIEAMPEKLRERLGALGLLDERRLAASVALSQLVDEFEASLLASGNTSHHARKTARAVRRVFDGCGFAQWSDVSPLPVERFLQRQRASGAVTDEQGGSGEARGIGHRQSNYLLGATKAFANWMVDHGRATENPLRVLKALNPSVDRRRERRALSPQEATNLLSAVSLQPSVDGVDGVQRALVYRLALETGLRASEIASLRAASFQLEGPRPTVTLQAAYSKRRREDVLPLRLGIADVLQRHLSGREPWRGAFDLPKHWRSAEMLAADLAAAGIAAVDDEGRCVDFHALRHTFITNLALAGVSPKVAQALARHSTITLTLDRYTHLRAEDERSAVDALPDLWPTRGVALRQTGTDCSASCSAEAPSAEGRVGPRGSAPETRSGGPCRT